MHNVFLSLSFQFGVKDTSRCRRPIGEFDQHASTISIAKELSIAQKTIYNHLTSRLKFHMS